MSFGLLPMTDNWMEQYKLSEIRKHGDCDTIPGWDTKNCCASCHDPGRTDTDLNDVNSKRICCHAERWAKGETWEYSQ